MSVHKNSKQYGGNTITTSIFGEKWNHLESKHRHFQIFHSLGHYRSIAVTKGLCTTEKFNDRKNF